MTNRLKVLFFVSLSVITITIVYISAQQGNIDYAGLSVSLVALSIILLFIRSRDFRAIIGENTPGTRPPFLWAIVFFLFIPFTLYTLFSDYSNIQPSTSNISIIALAPTLGALVFTAASNQRFGVHSHIELIAAAKKLLSATIFFLAYLPFIFFTNDVLKVDPMHIEWSMIGFVRWSSFVMAASSFYIGLLLFLVGIVDLIWALRNVPDK